MYFPHTQTSWDKHMFNGMPNSNFKIGLSLFGCAEKYTEQSTHCAVRIIYSTFIAIAIAIAIAIQILVFIMSTMTTVMIIRKQAEDPEREVDVETELLRGDLDENLNR